jgi:chromate reductase, NAD(P)H dehydrogenase (quinone)
MKILAMVGSLRKASYNRMALNAAIELAPSDVQVEIAEIGDLPLYNQDVEDAGAPSQVKRLKDQVRGADAILFASPEYNYSMSGVLKNAIDWVSRPPADSPFNGKPCGIISASTGILGGARAQYHLRQSAVFVNLLVMNKPEIVIAKAAEKFDANGKLTDETTRKMLATFMKSLKDWSERLRD